MLLTFRSSTAYCKIINLLPLSYKSTLLCPVFCDILPIFHLPVGTMLSFVGRGSQSDIKGRRGYSFRFWVLCCFPEMLGCQELTGHPVALTPSTFHQRRSGRLSSSFSSTPAGSIQTSLADTPLGGFPVSLLRSPASFSASPTVTLTDDFLLACSIL